MTGQRPLTAKSTGERAASLGGLSRSKSSQAGIGNQAMQRLLKAGVIQAKLAIGSSGDALEQEADRVADQVMRAPPGSPSAPQVRRKCADCENEEKTLRQKGGGAAASASGEAPASVHETLRAPGQPLDPATRAHFERRFGRDFSSVRVHTDRGAAESAREVNAHAFTVGDDIAFDAGRFAPDSYAGQKLLAHELTHVVQQGRASGAPRTVQRGPNDGAKTAVPTRPAKVIPGSTHLSRLAQAYYVDHPGLGRSTNVIAFSYSIDGGPPVEEVVESRGGVHTEAWMDERLRQIRAQARRPVALIEVYSERQPCGPSEADCESMLGKRYPTAKVTFGYSYQETQSPGPESRARRTRDELTNARTRVQDTKQLEWDFQNPKGNPPPHFERNDPGPISKAPRRGYSRWGSKAETAEAANAMAELEASAASSERLMVRIAVYMQALAVIQSVVSYLDVFTDAMDIFSSGTILGEQQKDADLIDSQSKELRQAIEDMEPPNQAVGLWIMVNVAISDKDTDTLTAIAEQFFNMHVSFDAKVRDLNGAADDLEQHGQELYDASMKAKEAATHGTEDVLMAQAAAQYISLEKLAGTYRSAAANYRAAGAALQTISDGIDDFGDAVNDQSWAISQDLAKQQYQREHGAPADH